jgi:hypothetical protein
LFDHQTCETVFIRGDFFCESRENGTVARDPLGRYRRQCGSAENTPQDLNGFLKEFFVICEIQAIQKHVFYPAQMGRGAKHMAEKPSVRQILEVYYALRAAGVQRLPKPVQRTAGSQRSSGGTLFLFDFNSGSGPHEGAPSILKRLLDRLPWAAGVEVCPAFASHPKSPDLSVHMEAVVTELRGRLESSGTRRVVCFGWRSGFALSVAFGEPYAIPPEAYEPFVCEAAGLGSVEILVLPDVRELEAFPEWRLKVWESLVAFTPALE